MTELTQEQIDMVSGAAMDDVLMAAFFTTVGAAGGFLIGGPVGAIAGGVSGFAHGVAIDAAMRL